MSRILKNLDNPTVLLLFTVQDWALLFLTNHVLISLIIGIPMVKILRKNLKKVPRFYFKRLLYWIFPVSQFNKRAKDNLPPSHVHTWIRR